ncbi:MAG: SCO family protein [Bryobacterales bacterium]|nr:SCO family protein [Bryobacterales bacterium]
MQMETFVRPKLSRRHILLTFATTACRRPSAGLELLPDAGQLPEFSLLTETGAPFLRRDLAGKVWVMDFIFTRCTLVCPRLTAEMRKMQQQVGSLPGVGLLSISIDPEYDTPRRLLAYAALHKAGTPQWRFLTGGKETIRALQVKTQRHLDPEEITAHGKQFYLLDGEGYIRGIYSMTVPGKREEVLADLRKLLRNPARPEPGEA